ncbi:MAG: prolyl oligopeptidase family serine peptidase [Planctomycetota bacterium]|nr:prolyl oligopeptidase family serine peptidase [Planctomycetota bacterium]
MPRLLFTTLFLLACAVPAPAEDSVRPVYPETPAQNTHLRMHGQSIPDPYRWLEKDDDEKVVAWDQAQMALVRTRLDAHPERKELKRRLDAEFALGGMKSLPRFRGGYRWYTYRPKNANQPVLYRTDAKAQQTPQVVLDPNRWARSGTAAIRGWDVSPNGRYVAYRRDAEGSEDTTLYVYDVSEGRHLSDRITRTKFASVVWTPDSKGFLYSRMPDPDSVPSGEAQYHRRIYHHTLGGLVQDDPMVYGRGRPMLESCWLSRSSDQQHLFLVRGQPYQATETFECTWEKGELKLTPLITDKDERTWIDRAGDVYVLNTDRNTGNREVFTAPRTPEGGLGDWTLVEVPRGERDVVKDVRVVGGKFLVVHMKVNVVSRLYVRALAGGPFRELTLPGPGTVGRFATRPDDTRIWLTFQSYARPTTIYRCDLSEAKPVLEAETTLGTTIDVGQLVSTQTTYKSKDGTAIPIFLLHRKDVKLDGSAPTILTGYGGFRVGIYPRFDRRRALWAEHGGVLAVACLRGGDEFGEAWHEAGSLANKQNVFDDFIAAADWLVESGKASRERLAIQGGSNGGLLVAVCVNQRPDLCAAAVCAVPLTDMLRFHRFQYARMWTKEYGDPDDAKAFAWIRRYSPYHNVRPATAYPAVLLTAGLRDGRVNAFHARKMAAAWQAASISDLPILLRVDRKGGHGAAGLARRKQLILDQWCFLLGELE